MKTTTSSAAPVAPIYVTEEAAAARYSISVSRLRRLRYAGKLKAIAMGPKLVRYSVASLDAFFEALARGGDGKAENAPRGFCDAWRARKNIRAKTPAAKSTGTDSGDAANENA